MGKHVFEKIREDIKMILSKVSDIIIDQLGLEQDTEIAMTTSLIGDLEADSLDAVEIIMALEDEYGIEIPDEVAEDFKTVGDIVSFVEDCK